MDSKKFNLKNVGLTTALTASMLGGMVSTSFADAVPAAEKADVNKDNNYQAEQKTEAKAYKAPQTEAEAKTNLDKANENVKSTGKVKDAAKVANDTAKAAKDDAVKENDAAQKDAAEKVKAAADAKEALDKAQAAKDKAQKEYNQAKQDKTKTEKALGEEEQKDPSAKGNVSAAQTNVDNAKKNADAAAANLKSAEEKLNQANAAAATAKSNYDKANGDYQSALAAQNNAENKLDEAYTTFDNEQNKLYEMVAGSPEAMAAQNELTQARSNLTQAQHELAQAKAVTASKLEAKNNAQAALDKANKDAADLKTLENDAASKAAEAKKAADAADAAQKNSFELGQKLNKKIDEVTSSGKQDEIDAAEEVLNQKKDDLAKANEKLAAAKANYNKKVKEAENATKNLGISFLDSVVMDGHTVEDYENAVKNSSVKNKYDENKINAALSKDNLKALANLLRENNQYRKSDNNFTYRGDLRLSPELVIESTLSAMCGGNHDLFLASIGNPIYLAGGENIAWGNNPIKMWMSEKPYYDEAVKQDPELKNVSAWEASTLVPSAGHYINLINPDYTVTGYGHIGTTYTQRVSASVPGKTYTADEWINAIDNYKPATVDTTAAKKAMDDAQKEVDRLTGEVNTQAKKVNDLEAALDKAKADLADLQKKSDEASKAYHSAADAAKAAKENSDKASTALEEYKNAHPDIVSKVSEAEAAAKTANEEYNNAVNDQKTKEAAVDAAKTEETNAKAALRKADAKVADQQDKVDKLNDDLIAQYGELEKLYEKTGKLKDTADNLKTELDNKTAEQTTAKSNKDNAVKDDAAAKETLNSAENNLKTVRAAHPAYSAALDADNEAGANLVAKTSALDAANVDLTNKTAALTSANEALQKANDRAAAAKTALENAEKTYGVKSKEYEDALKAYNQALADLAIAKADYDKFVDQEAREAAAKEAAAKEAAAKAAKNGKNVTTVATVSSKSPKTGDSANMPFEMTAFLGAAAALAAVMKKRKNEMTDASK